MYHLMCNCILQMILTLHPIGTDFDTVYRIKPSCLIFITSPAIDIRTRYIPTQLVDVFRQESYHGGVFQEVVSLAFAALDIYCFVPFVCVCPVGSLTFGGHGACEHTVEISGAIDQGVGLRNEGFALLCFRGRGIGGE